MKCMKLQSFNNEFYLSGQKDTMSELLLPSASSKYFPYESKTVSHNRCHSDERFILCFRCSYSIG